MKYTVEVQIINQGEVRLTQLWDDGVTGLSTQLINVTEGLKEQAIRQAMINLGWTPPENS